MGEGKVDKAQTTAFAEGVGILVLEKNFVAGLHALEAAIFELFEAWRSQKVVPFLLLRLRLLFRHRHGISVATTTLLSLSPAARTEERERERAMARRRRRALGHTFVGLGLGLCCSLGNSLKPEHVREKGESRDKLKDYCININMTQKIMVDHLI